MEDIDKNQKVNVAINGFIADFLIKLNIFKSIDEAIKFTENTINEVKRRDVRIDNDHILIDLDFVLKEIKGEPINKLDNLNIEKYYKNLRIEILKIKRKF